MSPHSFINSPPVVYRTTTPWWRRLMRRTAISLLVLVVVAFLVGCTTLLIAKLHATEVQLNQAHLAGMALGMKTCGGQ